MPCATHSLIVFYIDAEKLQACTEYILAKADVHHSYEYNSSIHMCTKCNIHISRLLNSLLVLSFKFLNVSNSKNRKLTRLWARWRQLVLVLYDLNIKIQENKKWHVLTEDVF